MLIYSWRLILNFRICSARDIRNTEFKHCNQQSWINTRDNNIHLFSDLCSVRGFGCSISAEKDVLLTYRLCLFVRGHTVLVCVCFIWTLKITCIWLYLHSYNYEYIHTYTVEQSSVNCIEEKLGSNPDRLFGYPYVRFVSPVSTCNCQERTSGFILVLYCSEMWGFTVMKGSEFQVLQKKPFRKIMSS